jgi:fatty acid CoA ligase FadD9
VGVIIIVFDIYYTNSLAVLVVQDGWYHTGDIGMLVHDAPSDNGRGQLRIIDRRNNLLELYINGDSIWIAPGKLEENVYRLTNGVEQVVLFADRNIGMIVAVVVPTQSFTEQYGVDRPARDEMLRRMIAQARSHRLAAHEIPVAVILEQVKWTIGNGGLSAIGKAARGELKVRYLVCLLCSRNTCVWLGILHVSM